MPLSEEYRKANIEDIESTFSGKPTMAQQKAAADEAFMKRFREKLKRKKALQEQGLTEEP